MADTLAKSRRFVRLRGLPYSAGENEIRGFFGPSISIINVHIVHNAEGKPSGDAYVQLATEEDIQSAIEKNQEMLGSRYVEVFAIGEVEIDQVVRKMERRAAVAKCGIIRVRGLPFSCTQEDLVSFFKDMTIAEVVFGKEPGEGGRATGEAYIRFETKEDAERALQLNGQYLGRRYLEIFHVDGDAFENFKDRINNPSSNDNGSGPRPLAEVIRDPWTVVPSQNSGYGGRGGRGRGRGVPRGRGGGGYGYDAYSHAEYDSYNDSYAQPSYGQDPYYADYSYQAAPASYNGRGGGGEGYGYAEDYAPARPRNTGFYSHGENITPNKVQMRGLPFRVSARQVEDFFSPLECIEIKTGIFEDGRASGDGLVEFASPEDAQEAMKRDRQSIKNRYIELFPHDQMKLPSGTTYKNIGGTGARSSSSGYQPKPLYSAHPWWELSSNPSR